MTATTSAHRAQIVREGAKAAREGTHRSCNPHPLAGEDWTNWMDGFDHQIVWLEHGRGPYEPFPDVAPLPIDPDAGESPAAASAEPERRPCPVPEVSGVENR